MHLQVVFAPGQSIESNLKNLAERRTDIFGVGDEAASEAMIGQKMGEEEVRKRLFHARFTMYCQYRLVSLSARRTLGTVTVEPRRRQLEQLVPTSRSTIRLSRSTSRRASCRRRLPSARLPGLHLHRCLLRCRHRCRLRWEAHFDCN